MTKTELAWAAGLVDGEGCLHISYTPPGKMRGTINAVHSLYLKVAMTDKKTIYHLWHLFGLGSVQLQCSKKKNHGIAYSWLCCAQEAATAIRAIRPYLITKAEEADVAIEFAAIPRQKGSSWPTQKKLLLRRHACYTRMCRLKPTNRRRGIFPKKLDLALPSKNSHYKHPRKAV